MCDERQWGEAEWEDYVDNLLSTHYSIFGGSYQRVKDLGGDCGLEGFTDTGEAFQSYADQDSKDNKARTKKQKKKITDDLNKLEEFKEFWIDIFGSRKIKRWTLMVPYHHDKQVMRHAKKEARRIVALGLPFIDDSFTVDVKSDEDYPVAKANIRTPRGPKIPTRKVSDEMVVEFEVQNPDFITNIDAKLRKVYPNATGDEIVKLRKDWLRWHLRSSDYLDGLFSKVPEFWEEIQVIVDTTAEAIQTEGPMDGSAPSARLKETRDTFEQTLSDETTFLDYRERQYVSFGTIAKWLGECPLDFPENGNA